MHRLLKLVAVRDVDEVLGLTAGKLRTQAIAGGTTPSPSGVDAIVAATADGAGDYVQLITSDPGDMTALLAHAHHASRVSVLPV